MPAHSFGPEWIDQLLRGDKQGTTRPQHNRVKVGDIVHIYNQQRRRIIDKPMRRTTPIGQDMIISNILAKKYPVIPDRIYIHPMYYAHFLGKVLITEVYDIHPTEMSGEELEAWAWSDGFGNFDPIQINTEQANQSANQWFSERYGNEWMQRTWTVERWHGWVERYFYADQSGGVTYARNSAGTMHIESGSREDRPTPRRHPAKYAAKVPARNGGRSN